MSVRKREWTTRRGEPRSGWTVDYFDTKGVRRLRTFKLKRDADAFSATATVEVRQGTHVADSASVTVEAAGRLWIEGARATGLAATTVAQYRQHLELHISPMIGGTKLSTLTVPGVRAFEDRAP